MAVLSGLFGRRRSEPTPESADVAPTEVAPALRRPRGEWRDLPPIEPVVTELLDTDAGAGSREFLRQLPTRWSAPPAIQPLSHDVRADLDTGVVHGLTTTVATSIEARDPAPAELRWWAGRRARRQAAAAAAAAGLPESDEFRPVTPIAEEPDSEVPGPAEPTPLAAPPAAPTIARPVTAPTPLPRVTPATPVLASPPIVASAIEPVYPPSALAPARPSEAEADAAPFTPAFRPAGLPTTFRPPAAATPADPTPLSGPARVVRPEPSPDAPARTRWAVVEAGEDDESAPPAAPPGVLDAPLRRRRGRVGPPLDPAEAAALTAPPTPGTPTPPRTSVPSTRPAAEADADATPSPRPADVGGTEAAVADLVPRGLPAIVRRVTPQTQRRLDQEQAALEPLPTTEAAPPDASLPSGAPHEESTPLDPAAPTAVPVPLPVFSVRVVSSPPEEPKTERSPLLAQRPLAGTVAPITSRAPATTQAAQAPGLLPAAAALAPAGAPRGLPFGLPNDVDDASPAGWPTTAPPNPSAPYAPYPGLGPAAEAPEMPTPPGGWSPPPGADPSLFNRTPQRATGPTGPTYPGLPAAPRPTPALPPPVELVAPGYVPPSTASQPTAMQSAPNDARDEAPAPQDQAELDQLARQLYSRVQGHLRNDLLVGRERAQMLTDLG
jgi:hypothetical protein